MKRTTQGISKPRAWLSARVEQPSRRLRRLVLRSTCSQTTRSKFPAKLFCTTDLSARPKRQRYPSGSKLMKRSSLCGSNAPRTRWAIRLFTHQRPTLKARWIDDKRMNTRLRTTSCSTRASHRWSSPYLMTVTASARSPRRFSTA